MFGIVVQYSLEEGSWLLVYIVSNLSNFRGGVVWCGIVVYKRS